MSFRFRNILLTGIAATAVVIGCTVNVDDDSLDGRDGTRTVESSRASALVTGRIDAEITGTANVYVNEQPRKLVVAPDRTFVVREVPSGNTTFAVEVLGIRGSVTIDGVKPGEVIEVEVRVQGTSLVIVITRRDASSEPPREVTQNSGAPLEIRANNVCYFLRAGTYDREIIVHGNNVKLLGAGGCNATERTILTGALTVKGNNALVQDIELRGRVLIEANNVRIQDACTGCFADACFPGGNGNGSSGGTPGGGACPDRTGGGECVDAGGSSSGGSSSGGFDAGSPDDAGSDAAVDAGDGG